MGVIPGDPWVNALSGIHDNKPSGQGNGKTEINGSQSNETPVIAVCQVAVGGDEIPGLLPSLHERTNGED